MSAALALIALVVGMLIGAVGIGGLLLIPALQALTGLPIRTAMATALSTFIVTGVLGTILFHRRGSIDWAITRPLCLGAVLFGFVGAWANAHMAGHVLSVILAALILAAGINTVLSRRPPASPVTMPCAALPASRRTLLFWIGAVAGFGSGLTGVGGPALSVPLLLLCGFSPLAAIGASQVVQIVAAVSGTLGNLQYGIIDLPLAALLTAFEVVGVCLGVYLVHRLNPAWLRSTIGLICILVGSWLLLRPLVLH